MTRILLLLSALALVGSAAERPNFLVIVVDDQAATDFRFYDPKSPLRSPNINRLAAEGMVIDRACQMGSWTGAVCTASRTQIMTGRNLWSIPRGRAKKDGATDAAVPDDLPEQTMAAVFNRAGYDTMRTCKRGNSYAAANAKFTVVHDATKRGSGEDTGSTWHAERVLDYLKEREARADKDPFLIYFGFSHPHDTREGRPELLAHYGATNHKDAKSSPAPNDAMPPVPVSWLPKHPFENSHSKVRDEVAVSGVWKHRDPPTVRNETGRDFACSENIDLEIGRVLDMLEAMGELARTYVIYTSDHGIALGCHGLMGKQNLYEHTWRVPLVVKGPGIKPGSRATGNVYLMDLLPTLCELASISIPETVNASSFKPVLLGTAPTIRETLYGAYCGGAKPGIRCVRQGDWKLIKYETEEPDSLHTQLFNLADNPNELLPEHHDEAVVKVTGHTPTAAETDLAADPAHAAKRRELEALLLAQMKALGDPYRFSDQK